MKKFTLKQNKKLFEYDKNSKQNIILTLVKYEPNLYYIELKNSISGSNFVHSRRKFELNQGNLKFYLLFQFKFQ